MKIRNNEMFRTHMRLNIQNSRGVLAFLLMFAIYLGQITVTYAADRTVCFELQIRDDRVDCPAVGTAGARRACNPGGYVAAVGHQVELWDKDSGSDDERIGVWYLSNPGAQCVTFPWEGESYHKGESDPDIYIKHNNRVNHVGYTNYRLVEAVQTNGNAHSKTSWRNGPASDPDRFVASNCQTGTSCRILAGQAMVPTNDIASLRGRRFMALDTAQRSLQVFGDIMDTHVNLHYPGRADCPTACAIARDEVHVPDNLGNHGMYTTHEIGHALHMQQFDRDELRNDCSRNGDGHGLRTIEYESCATTEGFAHYVAAISWWDPNNTSSRPQVFGEDIEEPDPVFVCASSAHTGLQVAKGFWDFDDRSNEAGVGDANGFDDQLGYGTTDILNGWRRFSNGNGNREELESDRDGVNMRDYWENNSTGFVAAGAFETLIQHNCLTAQTDG